MRIYEPVLAAENDDIKILIYLYQIELQTHSAS